MWACSKRAPIPDAGAGSGVGMWASGQVYVITGCVLKYFLYYAA